MGHAAPPRPPRLGSWSLRKLPSRKATEQLTAPIMAFLISQLWMLEKGKHAPTSSATVFRKSGSMG